MAYKKEGNMSFIPFFGIFFECRKYPNIIKNNTLYLWYSLYHIVSAAIIITIVLRISNA